MDAFVAGDALLLEADGVKKEMDVYADMISAEENKNFGCTVIYNTATESSIFPVKSSASDDSTAVSSNPSISSSINIADGTVDTKPLFGLEVVKSFEDTVVATESINSSINVDDGTVDTKPLFGLELVKSFEDTVVATDAEDERSVATSIVVQEIVQEIKKDLNRFVSIKDSELDAVETELSNAIEGDTDAAFSKAAAKLKSILGRKTSLRVADSAIKTQEIQQELNVSIRDSEQDAVETELLNAIEGESELASFASASKATIEKKAGDVAAKDTETVSIQKDDSEQPSTVTLAAETTASTTVAKPHADISYIPWMGVQLTQYQSMPKVWQDDVLIKVEATTISTRDCLERIRRDSEENLRSEVWVPGYEAVGRVVRAGSESKRFLGRRVAVLLPAGGGCSRYVRCNAANLIAVPERASSEDIVYLLSTYLTAYQCLEASIFEVNESCCVPFKMDEYLLHEDEGEAESLSSGTRRNHLLGKNVLISGAGSPVGLALIDIAKHAGAELFALSHNHHEDEVKEMVKEGGWYPLSQTEEWRTGLAGKMDLVVDTIGDYNNYSTFYDVMASGGNFMRMNTTSAGKKLVPVLMQGDKEYFSVFKDYKGNHINEVAVDFNIFDSFEEEKHLFAEDLTYLFKLLQGGKIKRRVCSHIDFEMVEQEWDKAVRLGYDTDILVVSCNEEGDAKKFIC